MRPFVFAASCAVSLLSGGTAIANTDLETRMTIIDTITDIASGTDRRDWARVRRAFADQVTLDYTSLWGGEAATRSADDIVAQWSAVLPGFDATLHLLANHTIVEATDAAAVALADFQALHRIDDEQWVLSGRYSCDLVAQLDGWKVQSMTMTWTHDRQPGPRCTVRRTHQHGPVDKPMWSGTRVPSMGKK